jgi:ComF family protein
MKQLHWFLDLLGEGLAPWTCSACGAEIGRLRAFCPPCAKTIEEARANDVDVPVVSLGEFGGALADAVHALKFRDRSDLATPLGRVMAARARSIVEPHTVLVPVPLGAERLRQRRYNQSALLARVMGNTLRAEVAPFALTRCRETAPQATLDRAARQENVEGAFVARRSLAGLEVVLVDDVTTTGATVRAAARAAENAGARVVGAAVIAIAS